MLETFLFLNFMASNVIKEQGRCNEVQQSFTIRIVQIQIVMWSSFQLQFRNINKLMDTFVLHVAPHIQCFKFTVIYFYHIDFSTNIY